MSLQYNNIACAIISLMSYNIHNPLAISKMCCCCGVKESNGVFTHHEEKLSGDRKIQAERLRDTFVKPKKCQELYTRNVPYEKHIKNPACQETPNLSTNADRSTNIFLWGKKEKNSIRNDSSFLRLYELVHNCTSPLVKHLPNPHF